ncbi:ATP-dependent sacrificial sulfur transferase LarE [Clostridium sp. PL3]|uniref:ATP-dependent sacrificial sulfur transferase LarE n=1 Tax=Clostridium thailandense TaxID=2794346 RepID=A0A949WS53_9CLOT|nr:ATP-dependent sacrificial sulfur transferase LarE [Clostridium thailandense]MBV7274716.1 ATP-dependent sacrificial sulfur transferase LarE [Clostridium thailandense]
MDNKKYIGLLNYMKDLGSVVVAFSGGVDSTFLLRAAKEALGDKVAALTIVAPYIPRWEVSEAKELVKKIGIRHEFLEVPTIIDEIKLNPKDRCYLCKKTLFSMVKSFAKNNGFEYVVDGTNVDDINEYRPGLRALKELGIRSPLLENGLTKSEIRELSKELDLPTWNKASYACLLSRIPYNTELREEDFDKIEKSERYMIDNGFKVVRVRCHKDLARIEVPRNDIKRLIVMDLLDEISLKFKEFGFKYVSLDVQGYKTGGFNSDIEGEVKQDAKRTFTRG